MKQAVITGLSAVLLAVLLPFYLLSPVEAQQEEDVLLVIGSRELEAEPAARREEAPASQPVSWDKAHSVLLDTGSGAETLTMQAYLTGVVLSEMPASFEMEALKAQAVAARTFTLRQMEGGKHADCDLCSDSACCQAWTSQENLQGKLGSAWQQYWDKAAAAVAETDGQVLTYGGQLIDAVYFSCSGGFTEDAVAVWGSEIPYLQSVESRGEESAAKFESQVAVPLSRFRELVTQSNPQATLSGPSSGWFGAVTATEGGGVDTMEIGGCTFEGTELRTLFGLNSTCFTVSITQEAVIFQVRGYGHRVGMSQYGANAMAQAGSTYEEILLHYYTGVTLEQPPKS